MTVPGDIQAPLSLLFQRRSILKLFKRLTVGYALPVTQLNIRQKARVLWQSLNLLSQCSEHVTIPHNFRICMRALRAARVTVVVPCVCVCVCVSVRSFLPPCTSRPRNIGTYVFTATRENFYNRDFRPKKSWFRSYCIICLPRMPPTTLKPQTTDTKGIS